MSLDKKPLLVILGPTATSKTDLALSLARKFNGELVSCDSRQVYKGLDIGTGKMPLNGRLKIEDRRWIVDGIPIHMYDVVYPKRQYSVARFAKDAGRIVEDIYTREKLPILVGGTGLYIKALVEGLSNLSFPVDLNLRKKLSEFSKENLQVTLKKISPERWKKMNYSDRQNPRRLIRAIELATSSRRSPFGHLRGGPASYETLKIGLTAARETLYKKADERVVTRINHGMIDEAKKLHDKGLSFKRMKQLGLEYGILAHYLTGGIKKTELIKALQVKIHGYIRRQLTWFKKEKNVYWFDIIDKQYSDKIEKMVSIWYDSFRTHATKN